MNCRSHGKAETVTEYTEIPEPRAFVQDVEVIVHILAKTRGRTRDFHVLLFRLRRTHERQEHLILHSLLPALAARLVFPELLHT